MVRPRAKTGCRGRFAGKEKLEDGGDMVGIKEDSSLVCRSRRFVWALHVQEVNTVKGLLSVYRNIAASWLRKSYCYVYWDDVMDSDSYGTWEKGWNRIGASFALGALDGNSPLHCSLGIML